MSNERRLIKLGRGRPPKDPNVAVSHGVMVQPKFPRVMYREIKAVAIAEGFPVAGWVRHLVYCELAKRRKKAS
jgi:hypothetical protein